jgi:hypothetical protein
MNFDETEHTLKKGVYNEIKINILFGLRIRRKSRQAGGRITH